MTLAEWLTPLNTVIGITGALGGAALGLFAWLRRERRGISEEIKASAVDRDERLDGVNQRIGALAERTGHVETAMVQFEARMEQLPTATQLHEMQLTLREVVGRIDGQNAILERVERSIERHDEAMQRIYDATLGGGGK